MLEEKGIKQTWLAAQLGDGSNIVNAYACKRRQPSLEVLFQIAKLLGVDVREIFESNINKPTG